MTVERPPTILIVDDESQNRRLLEVLLRPEGYETRTASNGPDALVSIHAEPPDLILLDVMLPGMTGEDVARHLKADPATKGIPIIMVTAQADRGARLASLEAGAEDFLTKPVDRAELWLRVRNLLRLKSYSDLLADQQSRLEIEVESRTFELQHLAHYDPLTGLPNRALFYETLAKTLEASGQRGWTTAVMFLDLDRFKNVNDTLGHGVGDALLVQVSQRLSSCMRLRDTVGRLGGDEFALILLMEGDPQQATAVASKIRVALRAPFAIQGHELTITASIGITASPADATDAETLIKYADTAMYEAKKAGRDTFRYFTGQMNVDASARLELEIALRRAVKNDEFVLHYQPKAHIDSGGISGMEALLRWQRPGQGLVPPNDFIPMLEESGLIVDVGRWVLGEACRQIGHWLETDVGPMQVAVNVSGRQLTEGDLEADVVSALEESGIPAGLLELELTESSLMANTEETITVLERLKRFGVQLSIDDFGTGYSSLAYLHRFPIDTLKIDLSFVRDITVNPNHAAIALAIIRMAHSLDLDVVAEGVETVSQLEYLRLHHCDQVQGYLLSRPLAVPELEAALRATVGLPNQGRIATTSTLLIVDDDSEVLELLSMVLAREGYRILTAASAAAGFEVLALEEVHVIICDQQMPDMGGTEFLGRVKALHPGPLRIMLTGNQDRDLIGTINQGEIYRFYTKPFNNDEIRTWIRNAFRHYWRLNDPDERRPVLTLPATVLAATS